MQRNIGTYKIRASNNVVSRNIGIACANFVTCQSDVNIDIWIVIYTYIYPLFFLEPVSEYHIWYGASVHLTEWLQRGYMKKWQLSMQRVVEPRTGMEIYRATINMRSNKKCINWRQIYMGNPMLTYLHPNDIQYIYNIRNILDRYMCYVKHGPHIFGYMYPRMLLIICKPSIVMPLFLVGMLILS